MTVMSVS